METWTVTTPLSRWLIAMAISFICLLITMTILGRERQNRRKPDNVVAPKYLSSFSYCCIILAPINTLWSCLRYFPGLCYLWPYMASLFVPIQFAATGFYQLARLYYSFSRQQVHSDKGYPTWLFIILFFGMSIWTFLDLPLSNNKITKKCWVGNDGTVVRELIIFYPQRELRTYSYFAVHSLYLILEVTIALLYWCKIWTFRKFQNGKECVIYERIQSVLHRILILTYFYMLIGSAWVVTYAASFLTENRVLEEFTEVHLPLMCAVWSYSMFLMQDHNTSEYIVFLLFIKRCKCVLCFCCFGSIINEQYRTLVENAYNGKVQKTNSMQTMNSHNMSIDEGHRHKRTGMELSIATKTDHDS